MGLDVYLNKVNNKALAADFDAKREALYEAEELILDATIPPDAIVTEINEPSTIDPDHLFRLGYFRSSYNDGGINTVLSDLGIPTLYDIFKPDDRYDFTPDWDDALATVDIAIDKLIAHMASPMGRFTVFDVSPAIHPNKGPKSKAEALALFATHLDRWKTPENPKHDFTEYQSAEGHFYKTGIPVFALIHGTSNILGPRPVTYVIAERTDLAFYLTALKIVRETIYYVMSSPERSKFYLTWST